MKNGEVNFQRERINPDRFYSQSDVQRITGFKTRAILTRYIDEGKLLAIKTGYEGPRSGIRYSIKGSWLLDFMDRYDRGLVQGKSYTKDEIRAVLEKALAELG